MKDAIVIKEGDIRSGSITEFWNKVIDEAAEGLKQFARDVENHRKELEEKRDEDK